MGRLLRVAILFSAFLLSPQALAQEKGSQQNITPVAQSPTSARVLPVTAIKESRQKNPFYIPRFSRENMIQQTSRQNPREQGLDYLPRNNLEPYNELKNFIRNNPVLKPFYEISTDNKPFQLYNGRINLAFSSSGRNSSAGNGLVRKLLNWVKK